MLRWKQPEKRPSAKSIWCAQHLVCKTATHRQVFSVAACSGLQRTRFSCPARTHRLHCECSPLDRYLEA